MFCCSLVSIWEREYVTLIPPVYKYSALNWGTQVLSTLNFRPWVQMWPACPCLVKYVDYQRLWRHASSTSFTEKGKTKGGGGMSKTIVPHTSCELPLLVHIRLPLSFIHSATKSPAAGSAASIHECPVLVLWTFYVITSTQSLLIACLDFPVLWTYVHKMVVCSPACF